MRRCYRNFRKKLNGCCCLQQHNFISVCMCTETRLYLPAEGSSCSIQTHPLITGTKRGKRGIGTHYEGFSHRTFFPPITVFETFIKVCNKSDLHIQSFTTMRILLCHLFIKSHYNMSHFPVLAFKNTPHASLPSNGLFYSVVFLKLILLLQLYGLLSCMVHFRK